MSIIKIMAPEQILEWIQNKYAEYSPNITSVKHGNSIIKRPSKGTKGKKNLHSSAANSAQYPKRTLSQDRLIQWEPKVLNVKL